MVTEQPSLSNVRTTRRMRKAASLAALAGLAVPGMLFLGGCEVDSFIDQSVTGRWEMTPTTVPVLERLAAIEGPAGAGSVETTPVRPEDLIPVVDTYRVDGGDAIEVRIQDLLRPDTEEAFPRLVDPRGFIDLPKVGRLYVSGLNEEEIKDLVGRTLVDIGEFTRRPSVSVTVTRSLKQTFNILGGVGNPGLYPIPRPDYRLLEALTASGRFSENAQSVFVIRYIPLTDKVIRGDDPRPPARGGAAPGAPAGKSAGAPGPGPAKPPENVVDLIDELAKPKAPAKGDPGIMPAEFAQGSSNQPVAKEPPIDLDSPAPKKNPPSPVLPDASKGPAPKSEPKPEGQPDAKAASEAEKPAVEKPTPAAAPMPAEPEPERFWVFREGKWVQVAKIKPGAARTTPGAAPRPPVPMVPGQAPEPLVPVPGGPAVPMPAPGGDKLPAPEPAFQPPSVPGAEKLVTQRVIEVPMAQLVAGSAQFNIIVRPGDVIRVPSAPEGIVYVGGEVNRPGTYQLPANGRLTLQRVMVSAGGLSSVGVPERVDITRMVAPDRQATIRVNYKAIAEGTMPDIFMKSDDVVNVGTNFWAFPLAVVRQGFRFSYGFGFILDRNFDTDIYGSRGVNGQ